MTEAEEKSLMEAVTKARLIARDGYYFEGVWVVDEDAESSAAVLAVADWIDDRAPHTSSAEAMLAMRLRREAEE